MRLLFGLLLALAPGLASEPALAELDQARLRHCQRELAVARWLAVGLAAQGGNPGDAGLFNTYSCLAVLLSTTTEEECLGSLSRLDEVRHFRLRRVARSMLEVECGWWERAAQAPASGTDPAPPALHLERSFPE